MSATGAETNSHTKKNIFNIAVILPIDMILK
jgi:hypothetical protein